MLRLVLQCLALTRALAGVHFAEGSTVQWPDGASPSMEAAELLVESQRARDRQPWLMLICCVVSCGVPVAAMYLLRKCPVLGVFFRVRGARNNGGSWDDIDVDLEAGIRSVAGEHLSSEFGAISSRNSAILSTAGRHYLNVARAAFRKRRSACLSIHRVWRKCRAIGVLGKRLLRQGAVSRQFREAGFDPEDLVEQTWPVQEKWAALQHAPAFVQCEPTVEMRYETQRLILSRLCGNVGNEVLSPEELQQCSSMVFAACKVVGGVMCMHISFRMAVASSKLMALELTNPLVPGASFSELWSRKPHSKSIWQSSCRPPHQQWHFTLASAMSTWATPLWKPIRPFARPCFSWVSMPFFDMPPWWSSCICSCSRQKPLLGLLLVRSACGAKLTFNYGKSTFFSWVNQLFLWPPSIANC